MIAVHVVQRDAWEPKLHALGCRKYADRQPLATAEVWETKDGLLFLVPIDNAVGALRSDELNTVLAQVATLVPTEYE